MSERKMIFRAGREELMLPVTPTQYRMEHGINVEVVNIHQLGDVNLAGRRTLATVQLSCMFPARSYRFARSSDPQRYIERLEKWTKNKIKLRWIVSGTDINLPVIIERFSYGEQDGTNDVYADIVLREYRPPQAVTVSKTPGKPRADVPVKSTSAKVDTYPAEPGDTLCGICREQYGDGSYAMAVRLAKYNGRPNPNILMVGDQIKIPHPLP